jgi:glutamate-1-semialdehyde 2,1-aminomutase
VPEAVVQATISLPFNDIDALKKVMADKGDKVACVIVEPVAGNMGLVAPEDGFLKTMRELTEAHGAVLIFDEVMAGFRVAYGGAQSLYGITPDLSSFGKVIGGGLPVAAYGGKREIMSQIAPQGSIYQAGTLSGNPLAMAAGIATLKELKKPGVYEALDERSKRLITGLGNAAQKAGVAARVGHVGSMLGMFFTDQNVANFDDAKTCDLEMFSKFYQGMRQQGIYIAPSQFEVLFLSTAHDDEHIDTTISAAEKVFEKLGEES